MNPLSYRYIKVVLLLESFHMFWNKDHTFPWICPQDFLERPLNLVFDDGQTETGILSYNDLMF